MGSTFSRAAVRKRARDVAAIKKTGAQTNPKHVEYAIKRDINEPSRSDREWTTLLNKLGGTIRTDSSHSQAINEDLSTVHVARRSARQTRSLPGMGSVSEENLHVQKRNGRLSQAEVLKVFDLRRSDAKRWDADAVAQRFGISQRDASDLIGFSRSYRARTDEDGVTRAYYKVDESECVVRFEKE